MPKVAKELDNRKDGDRGSCRVCNPPDPTRYVSADRLWHWSLENPGENPFRDEAA